MKRHVFTVWMFVSAVALVASAGTLHGKVASPGQNTVVYVGPVAGKTFPANPVPFQIDQQGSKFEPHLLVIQQGSSVVFKNDDNMMHNVRWPSVNNDPRMGHNLGTWSQGDTRTYQFDHPGVLLLQCSIHPDMAGYIVVVPTPYYAQATTGGDYTIRSVPDGHYTVNVWREGKKQPETKQITVAGDTTLDF
jgi:plastocyanin